MSYPESTYWLHNKRKVEKNERINAINEEVIYYNQLLGLHNCIVGGIQLPLYTNQASINKGDINFIIILTYLKHIKVLNIIIKIY